MQRFFPPAWRPWEIRTALVLAATLSAFGGGGCTAFNPAFVNLLGGDLAASLATIPNPPGHVVVAFINNAEIAESLVSEVKETLDLSAEELANLHPRVRLRMRITFVDGTFQTVEMISGSRDFVEGSFNAEAEPDLNQNDLTNVVVQCDVAQVGLEPGSNIEVFIPVRQQGFQLVEVDNTDSGATATEFQPRLGLLPQFRALAVDDVDADGNIVLRRNVNVRDQLTSTFNVVCGSVVAINMDGVLSVPFQINAGVPSFDQDDIETVASIGGRFEFRVTVR